MRILFKNAKILDLENGVFMNGAVEIENEIITNVGKFNLSPNYDREIDCLGNILMPGFVNTHCHTPMTLLRSFKDDATLNEWLFDNILPAEGKLSPSDVYWGQYLGIMESVRAGITTFEEGYFHNPAVCKAIEKSGIRARIGLGPAMRKMNITNIEYMGNEAKIIKNNSLIKPVCFVHSIYTINQQAIEESIEFTNQANMPLSIHLAETEKEVLDCKKERNKTPVEYLNELGFFNKQCLCYHSIHLNDSDINILKEKNVSVTTCPSSNIKLASGIAPIYELQQKGINITIGTDGVASNNSLDMFKEMFLVATLSKVSINRTDVVSALDVLKMATINGAKALGFNSGEIKTGKQADIILIDINQPHYYPQDDLISHLVYAGKSSDVYLTMVNGKILYENGKYNIGETPTDIYNNCNEIRKKLKNS